MSKLDQIRANAVANRARKNTPKASGKARKAPSGPLSGGPSLYSPAIRTAEVKPQVIAVQETGSRLPVLKRGRPKVIGTRPWEAAGMSRRSWYRRQKANQKDEAK